MNYKRHQDRRERLPTLHGAGLTIELSEVLLVPGALADGDHLERAKLTVAASYPCSMCLTDWPSWRRRPGGGDTRKPGDGGSARYRRSGAACLASLAGQPHSGPAVQS
jgi:hypothetical protein